MTRTSPVAAMARMFGIIFVVSFIMAMFFNGVSGRDLFPLGLVIVVSAILTIIFAAIGSTVVTAASDSLLRNDPQYQQYKATGGRPYWDHLPYPISSGQPTTLQWPEPQYTDFVPPPHWQYQCPQCGARVEKQIDVCWMCHYGANGDSSAYYERHGQTPPSSQQEPADWQPIS